MNPDNYCTMEAAKRLHEKGIVTETEAMWEYDDPCSDPSDPAWNQYGSWTLVNKPYKIGQMHNRQVPAPMFTEIWRKLPECIPYNDTTWAFWSMGKQGNLTNISVPAYGITFTNDNPADAAIDLLIWVEGRKEK